MENNSELTALENLRKKASDKATIVKWTVGLGAALVIAPLTYVAAYAVFGLALLGVALGTAGTVAMGLVWYAPTLSMKIKNRAIAAIEAEARKNPIVTTLSVYYARESALETSLKEIAAFGTEVEMANGLLREHTSKFPEDVDAISEMTRMQRMSEAALEKQGHDYRQAKQSQVDLWKTIERLRSRYQTSLAAIKANNAGRMNTGDIYESLKLDTSYQAVMRTSAEAFSQLRVSLLESDTAVRRSSSPQLAIELDHAAGIHTITARVETPVTVSKESS